MRFGSVCSGIEAASVAFSPLGWSAAWFSEIEPFPCAVLAHRHPAVPNLGDMLALPDRIASGEVEAPDLLCGGTPCQAFSVAGLRKSLDDARGNLSLTFCEIANAIDNARTGKPPAVILWENVPGVLSTADNAFGCFLAGLAGEDAALQPAGGKWSNAGAVYGPRRTVAWRTLDAQYFGLAQRRRRVFVVASARDDFDPVAVLFEFDGVRRDIAPSRGETEDATAGTLRSTDGGSDVDHARAQHLTAHTLRAEGFDASEDGTGRGTPLVPVLAETLLANGKAAGSATQQDAEQGLLVAYGGAGRMDFDSETFVTMFQGHGSNIEVGEHVTGTLLGNSDRVSGSAPCVGFAWQAGGNGTSSGAFVTQGSPTLQKSQTMAVAFQLSQSGVRVDEVHATLGSNNGSRRHNGALLGMQARRLTPRECERLQGFPDDYTLIEHRGKPAADGPRYKALGNSWAVPCVRWIGARIQREVQQ